jgi:hypothetical protein
MLCLQKVVTQYFVNTVEKKEIAQGNFVPYVEGVLMQPLRNEKMRRLQLIDGQ